MSIEYLTSESVTEGHPDKICDQIADAILDAHLKKDPHSRVACEVLIAKNLLVIAGEISSLAKIKPKQLANIGRQVLIDIGYKKASDGVDYKKLKILLSLSQQSPDITQGVIKPKPDQQGAGDQGIMYGFAVNETKTLMPIVPYLSHLLAKRLGQARKRRILPFLKPDGKTQITMEYKNNRPYKIRKLVVSTQHDKDVSIDKLKRGVIAKVIKPIIPQNLMDRDTEIFINPTGRFVVGGPAADTGLTGRKIIVDTYGGFCRHGGGAFSGKDPSKVDRSGAYMARLVAKSLVASGKAQKAEIKIAYVIGVAQPLAIQVNSFGTSRLSNEELGILVKQNFDFRPGMIIKNLNLLRPIYRQTAVYGHFGRDDLDLCFSIRF